MPTDFQALGAFLPLLQVRCLQDFFQDFYTLVHFLKSSFPQMLALCDPPSQGRSRSRYPLQPCRVCPCSDYQDHRSFNDFLEEYSAPIILYDVFCRLSMFRLPGWLGTGMPTG
ncbi:hypothetical protein MSAN_02340600 [Mycena sanguinolenta]|uniref:Uncharacterized protein n=1 Tax=Mycena sanguinolenta TaxID=230812 RepID=A0A8H6X689_9AGAR|nr:hypothetical protein MSAN_02340600 [Mycena sanguinolenta]